jgi:hypothetical protein
MMADVAVVSMGTVRRGVCPGCASAECALADVYGLAAVGPIRIGTLTDCDSCGLRQWRCAYCLHYLDNDAGLIIEHLQERHAEPHGG